MKRLITLPMIAAFILPMIALAQSAAETDMAMDSDMESTETINSFDDLSTGNKMIARSLMDAQTLPGDGTTQAWNLDDIAAARAETGWGNVFKQMQTEGLIEAKNLGEVVSAHARASHQPVSETVAMGTGMPADEDVNNAEDEEAAESMESEGGETAMNEAAADIDGSFEQLSTGNKKIARSLMDAQTLPADSSTQPWNLDQIAAAKGETGWGNVFQQMQAEGLIEAKNLGQVVSQYRLQNPQVTPATNAALATAATAGSTSIDRLPEQAHDNAADQADKGLVTAAGGNSNNATGITTAASNTNGNAHGLTKHTVSASDGITTANGATVSAAGNNAAVTASAGGSTAVTASNSHAAGHSAAASVSAGNGQGHAHGRSK